MASICHYVTVPIHWWLGREPGVFNCGNLLLLNLEKTKFLRETGPRSYILPTCGRDNDNKNKLNKYPP